MNIEDVNLTKLWIERFVIGLRLCPFAHFSFYDDTIYYETSANSRMDPCVKDVLSIVETMETKSSDKLSNAFLIFEATISFDFMLQMKEKSDNVLKKKNLEAVFQTVVFHPDFQFSGESFQASGNFTNRSPLPMLHILRVDEVAHAIDVTEDVDDIPFRNKELLEKINIKQISEVFKDDFIEKNKAYI